MTINASNHDAIPSGEQAVEYDVATVVMTGSDNFTLDWLKAKKVIITNTAPASKARAAAPQVKLSDSAKEVIVMIASTVTTDSAALPKVEVKAAGVTVPATTTLTVSTTETATVTLTGAVGELIVNGGESTTITGSVAVTELTASTKTVVNTTSVGTVNAANDVTVGATVGTVNVTAEATIDGAGTITTINADAATTIATTGAVTTVEASAPVTVNKTDGTITTLNTNKDVTVDAGTVTTVNVTATGSETVTVSVNKDITTPTINKTADSTGEVVGQKVDENGDKTADLTVAQIQAKPADTDYEVVTATKANPTATISIKAKADGKLEYYDTENSMWVALDSSTGIAKAGTYQIRTKASGTEGQDTYIKPSEPVEVTIEKFTGWADDGKHYADSVVSKDQWVVKTDGAVECYVNATDGTVTVTFTKDNCKVTDGKFSTGLTGTGAKLVIATGSTAGTAGEDFVYSDSLAAGTYTVQAAVGEKKSELTATVTIAEKVLATPTFTKTDVTTEAKGTITITNFVEGAAYKLLQDGTDTRKTLNASHAFTELEAGTYKVTVEKDGFTSAETTDIVIAPAQTQQEELKAPTAKPTAPTTKGGDDGSIEVTNYVEGANYILLDSTGADTKKVFDTTTHKFTGLSAGTYTVKVEKNSASAQAEVTVEDSKEEVTPPTLADIQAEGEAPKSEAADANGKIVIKNYDADADYTLFSVADDGAETDTKKTFTADAGSNPATATCEVAPGKYKVKATKTGVTDTKEAEVTVPEYSASTTPTEG